MKSVLRCFLLICVFSFSIKSIGQQWQYPFMCGHNHVMDYNEKQYPGYRNAVIETFRNVHNSIKRNSDETRNNIFTIPVVVHIVWKSPEENIDDSLIFSQINILNDAFRLQNEDKDSLRDIFKERQGDAGIEFRLESVQRVKTNANFALSLTGLPDKVKRSNDGGSDAFDPDKFLNIWVCRIQPIPILGAQILGYAYPPADLSNWPAGSAAPSKALEGVVIDFRVFGRNNPNILTLNGQQYNAIGRTTVHEVGHYLGLRHIWGDGGGLFGGSSCGEDDGISDTPNQGAQTGGGCDKTLNTCIDAIGTDFPDMIENYMDYSGESCQNTFTKGQIDLMRAVLQNQRKLLVGLEKVPEINDKLSVWPNPVRSTLNFSFQKTINTDNIELWDAYGRLLKKIKPDQNEIDMSSFRSGIYFLRFYHDLHPRISKVIKVNE